MNHELYEFNELFFKFYNNFQLFLRGRKVMKISTMKKEKASVFLLFAAISLVLVSNPVSTEAAELSFDPPAANFRLFNKKSPWNTRIDKAPLQTEGTLRGVKVLNSSDYISHCAKTGKDSTIAVGRWTIPIYFVNSKSTPGVNIGFTGEKYYNKGFLKKVKSVPIPEGATSDPGDTDNYPPLLTDIMPEEKDMADAHLCIIDVGKGFEYDFWHMAQDNSENWKASVGNKFSIKGNGVVTKRMVTKRNYFARGTAVPIAAGVILRSELKAGEIKHALAMAIPDSCNQANFYVWPGLITDGETKNSKALPEGARLRLKWTEAEIEQKFNSGELSKGAKTIALALRRYGAINIDNGAEGHLSFQAQNISDTDGSRNVKEYNGLLDVDEEGYAYDLWNIGISDFEVIRFEYGKKGKK